MITGVPIMRGKSMARQLVHLCCLRLFQIFSFSSGLLVLIVAAAPFQHKVPNAGGYPQIPTLLTGAKAGEPPFIPAGFQQHNGVNKGSNFLKAGPGEYRGGHLPRHDQGHINMGGQQEGPPLSARAASSPIGASPRQHGLVSPAGLIFSPRNNNSTNNFAVSSPSTSSSGTARSLFNSLLNCCQQHNGVLGDVEEECGANGVDGGGASSGGYTVPVSAPPAPAVADPTAVLPAKSYNVYGEDVSRGVSTAYQQGATYLESLQAAKTYKRLVVHPATSNLQGVSDIIFFDVPKSQTVLAFKRALVTKLWPTTSKADDWQSLHLLHEGRELLDNHQLGAYTTHKKDGMKLYLLYKPGSGKLVATKSPSGGVLYIRHSLYEGWTQI
ncbi:unnamed protein product [Amoebophrya sp. A25]|nr:unnamed protein product [Amoebophrya sp. A25]|eukprot:GSA25T00003588001.1